MLQRLSLFVGRAFTFHPSDLRREDGQTTLEYTIVAALVVAMAVAAFVIFSAQVSAAVTKLGTYVQNQVP